MVEIVNYKTIWAFEFQTIAKRQRSALGDLALRIDHIGSTSVPGLAAKDVIDIQISVAEFSSEVIAAMASIGYSLPDKRYYDHIPPEFEGDQKNWQKMYFKAPESQRRTHTHMRVLGYANQIYPILFRDYLRCHAGMAQAYAELKRRLAAGLADPNTYPEVKDPAVDLIYFAAQDWARETGWQMGPSDA
ncbi:MAG: GrpB family protein [Anaerolineaceae bacterium]